MNCDECRINPAWISAPYEVDYLFRVPVELRSKWSRKRRLKFKRRLVRQMERTARIRLLISKKLSERIETRAMMAMFGFGTPPKVCSPLNFGNEF